MTPIERLTFSPTIDELPWEGKDLNSINLKSSLTKWNVLPDLAVKSFVASCRIEKKDEVKAIEKIFANPSFLSSIKFTDDDIMPMNVQASRLACTVLNMNFFHSLIDFGLISKSGYIHGCYEEEIDGILVQDKLRLMLANDNQGDHTLPLCDRKEFIFHLLKLVSLGGAKCQHENNFDVLSDAIKILYKHFIQVRKTSSGNVEICSSVYELTNVSKLYPYPNNVHNKCYAIINGQKISLVLNLYNPFW